MYPPVDSGPSAHMPFHILSVQSHQASAPPCFLHREEAVAEEAVPPEAGSAEVAAEAGRPKKSALPYLFFITAPL